MKKEKETSIEVTIKITNMKKIWEYLKTRVWPIVKDILVVILTTNEATKL